MVEKTCTYTCTLCMKQYPFEVSAIACEGSHIEASDMTVSKVDHVHAHESGHPQAITIGVKGNKRAVYVLRHVEGDNLPNYADMASLGRSYSWYPSTRYRYEVEDDINGMLP
jgi:hypothetical protein